MDSGIQDRAASTDSVWSLSIELRELNELDQAGIRMRALYRWATRYYQPGAGGSKRPSSFSDGFGRRQRQVIPELRR